MPERRGKCKDAHESGYVLTDDQKLAVARVWAYLSHVHQWHDDDSGRYPSFCPQPGGDLPKCE